MISVWLDRCQGRILLLLTPNRPETRSTIEAGHGPVLESLRLVSPALGAVSLCDSVRHGAGCEPDVWLVAAGQLFAGVRAAAVGHVLGVLAFLRRQQVPADPYGNKMSESGRMMHAYCCSLFGHVCAVDGDDRVRISHVQPVHAAGQEDQRPFARHQEVGGEQATVDSGSQYLEKF